MANEIDTPLVDTGTWLDRHRNNIQTIGGVLATTFLGVSVLLGTIRFTQQFRVTTVQRMEEHYQAVSRLSIEHPHLANPALLNRPFTAEESEQYQWYVGILTDALDGVLTYPPNPPKWVTIATSRIKVHCRYFTGSDYNPALVSENLRNLVAQVTSGHNQASCE